MGTQNVLRKFCSKQSRRETPKLQTRHQNTKQESRVEYSASIECESQYLAIYLELENEGIFRTLGVERQSVYKATYVRMYNLKTNER